ncbi:hypothetical protein F4824DRAFT_498362 [Ustulina deusta]|nr:hypothetical protein F4824DRAFT_498362 [Ustulina deusta]
MLSTATPASQLAAEMKSDYFLWPLEPGKEALRALSDTPSQEMHPYAAAHLDERPVRLPIICPSTILGEAYCAENEIKTGVVEMLKRGEERQTRKAIARKIIRA